MHCRVWLKLAIILFSFKALLNFRIYLETINKICLYHQADKLKRPQHPVHCTMPVVVILKYRDSPS